MPRFDRGQHWALHKALPGISMLDEEEPKMVDMNTCATFANMNDGVERAVSELVQNWADARRNAQESAEYHGGGKWVSNDGNAVISIVDGVMVLTNHGKVLPRSAFAHGGTDKRDTTAAAGFFGDGLKLVCAMVARNGWDFGIVSGGVHFTFFLTDPDSDGHRFLMRSEQRCDTSTHAAAEHAVTVYLEMPKDFDAEEYLKACFILLGPQREPEVVVEGIGSVYK